MKIALVSPYEITTYGGVNHHVGKLAAEFASQGHTVKIMAPCNDHSDTVNGVPLFSLGWALPFHTAGSIAKLSPAAWRFWAIKRFLQQENFDVIHTHEPFAPMSPYLVTLLAKPPIVATFHSYAEATRRLLIWKPLLKPLDNAIDARIAVSDPSKEFVERHFPGDYTVIPNGIEVDHFAEPRKRRPEFDDGKINVLFVGRAEKRKGLKNLIGAFARLKWHTPNIRLIVVGPGNPDHGCAAYMAERGVGPDICYVGAPSYNDLPSYHHSADIFCTPSTDRESFGMVLAEAMAAGLPCIATNIAGHRSVVEDDNNALLVPPRDEEALAQALAQLIKDATLRERLGSAAREKAESYRWSTVSSSVIKVYESAIAAKAKVA